jgi:tetratricopeptide (TPR) repeat protein
MNARHSFGDQLRILRRRIRLNSAELAAGLGYSTAQLVQLETNQRVPDADVLTGLFVPTLNLQTEHELAIELLAGAEIVRAEHAIVVRVDDGVISRPDPGWWLAASTNARNLAALLSVLTYPIDLRSAIVVEACEGLTDVRDAARELRAATVTGSLDEAMLASETRAEVGSNLTDDARRRAHAAAAIVSERLYNDFVGALRHYIAAEDVAAASEVVFDRTGLIATRGEAAVCVDQLEIAIKLARRAQAETPVAASLILSRILAARGELLAYLGRDSDAERHLREAADLARPAERRAQMLILLAQTQLRRGQGADAQLSLAQAVDALTALDTVLLCRTSALQAQALQQQGQTEAASAVAERALWLCSTLHSLAPAIAHGSQAMAGSVLGAIHRQRGQPQLALHHFAHAAHAAQRAGLHQQRCLAHLNAAYVMFDLGMADAARVQVDVANAALVEDDPRLRARILALKAMLAQHAGDLPTAEALAREVATLRRQTGDFSGWIAAQAQIARIAIDAGDAARALQLATHLEVESRDGVEPHWRAYVLDTLVLTHLARADLAAAHTALDALRRAAALLRHPVIGAALTNHEALFCLMRGLPIDALRLVSTPLPPSAGCDAEWERRLIEALATLAIDNSDMGLRLLRRIANGAENDGFIRIARIARRAQDALAHQDTGHLGRQFFHPLVETAAAND